MGQLYFQNKQAHPYKKRSELWLPGGVEEGELDESGQMAQTSGYKINKY